MRFGRTHDILGYASLPKYKKKIIRQVNREIDNPSPFMKQYRKRLGFNKLSSNRIPGMIYYPHRRMGGHDFIDGVYFYNKYGQAGFDAWLNHTGWDMFRDNWVKSYGSDGMNFMEDAIVAQNRRKSYKKWYK